MLSRPTFFPEGLAARTIAHSWTNDISDSILYPTEFEHPRLRQALAELNLRGQFLALTAALEWVSWKLEPLGWSTDLQLRIEASYAALASAAYSNLRDQPLPSFPKDVDINAKGPILMACRLLTEGFRLYCELNPLVGDWALRAVLLVQAISPPLAGEYEFWIEALLRRIATNFADDSRPLAEVPRVGRYFILDNEPFDVGRNAAEIDQFLQYVETSKNPYLNTPEVMRSLGFAGRPYRFP